MLGWKEYFFFCPNPVISCSPSIFTNPSGGEVTQLLNKKLSYWLEPVPFLVRDTVLRPMSVLPVFFYFTLQCYQHRWAVQAGLVARVCEISSPSFSMLMIRFTDCPRVSRAMNMKPSQAVLFIISGLLFFSIKNTLKFIVLSVPPGVLFPPIQWFFCIHSTLEQNSYSSREINKTFRQAVF